MNQCRQCGRELAANSPVCVCGAPVPGAVPQSAAYAPPQAAVGQFAPPYGTPMGPPKTSTKAIVGFVLSLMPCALLAIPGFVLGIIARGEIKRSNGSLTGGGLALASIILASVWLTVGTFGMLAAIAIPNFIKFQARSKQTEVKANMNAMAAQLRAFQQDNPGKRPTHFDDLGGPPQTIRYSYALGANGERVDAPMNAQVATPEALDDRNAVVVAWGNVDNDPYVDVWIIDRKGAVVHVQDDVADR